MKKFKKVLSVFLAVLVMIMVVPFSSLTASALTPASTDNVYLDALKYIGWKYDQCVADGNLFNDTAWGTTGIQPKYKSNVPYGSGCTGLEVNAYGLPDVARFESGGFVCAQKRMQKKKRLKSLQCAIIHQDTGRM